MKRKLYNALDVACFIINYCNDNKLEITNFKLQKLLYFVQAASFKRFEKEFFYNDIEAWPTGSVIPDVYDEFFIYTGNNIPKTDRYLKFNEETDFYDTVYFNENIFLPKDKKLIEDTIELCKDYEAYELTDIIHSQKPYQDAYRCGVRTIISNSAMREYFLENE